MIKTKLHAIAADAGYRLDHIPTRRVRGWPEPSRKPFHLAFADGTHIASFATVEKLEDNLRARAGC